jgi:ribosome-binding protein aMBF1 (putative translation factor)
MKCDVCGRESDELFDLHIDGDNDLYMFDVCEDCLDKYQSDTYTAEDVLKDINIEK